MSKIGLGMRTIKTAISVLICLGIAQLVPYQTPVFACVAAVVCMMESPERSLTMGRIRLIGTGIGGAIGIAFLWIFSSAVATAWQIILIPLAIAFGFMICNLLKQKLACPICGVVIVAVMIAGGSGQDQYIYALTRVLETGAGVIVTVAVNALISSRRPGEDEPEE